MAVDPNLKVIRQIVDSFSDTRTNVVQVLNTVLRSADNNDYLQVMLYKFVIAYIYNRAVRHRLGLVYTDNQIYICQKCDALATVLDPEFAEYKESGRLTPEHDLTEFDSERYTQNIT